MDELANGGNWMDSWLMKSYELWHKYRKSSLPRLSSLCQEMFWRCGRIMEIRRIYPYDRIQYGYGFAIRG